MKRVHKLVSILSALLFTGTLGLGACAEVGGFDITVLDGEYGNIITQSKAHAGELVKVNLKTKKGYEGYQLYVNGERMEGNTFIMPSSDVEITYAAASVSSSAYTVTVEESEYGTAYADLVAANEGDTVTLTNYVCYNSEFLHYTVNGQKIDGNSFIMPAGDVTVAAEYSVVAPDTDITFDVDIRFYEGRAHFYTEYTDVGVKVRAVAEDKIPFTSKKAISNIAMTDNVEFILGVNGNTSFNSKYCKFIVNYDGEYFFDSYNNGWKETSFIGTKVKSRKLNLENAGFSGYEVEVEVPYGFFGLSKKQAVGNITICPAMRNTLNGWHSAWGSYTGKGCDWANPASHLLIDENGVMQANYQHADYLYMGDEVFANTTDLTVKTASIGQSSSLTKKDVGIDYWEQNLDLVNKFTPKEVVFSGGKNDLDGESVLSVFKKMQSFINAFKQKYPTVKLVIVSAIPMITDGGNPEKTVAFNQAVEEYVQTLQNVSYVDVCSGVYENGVFYKSAYGSTESFSENTQDYLFKKIAQHYNVYEEKYSGVWGSNGVMVATDGWTVTNNSQIALNAGGTQNIYRSDFNGEDFALKAEITANGNFNGDVYPKFGITVTSSEQTRWFYVAADNMTLNAATYIDQPYTGYPWGTEKLITVPNLTYTNGNYATLQVVKKGAELSFKVNDVTIFSGSVKELKGNVKVGFRVFNLSLNLRNIVWTTDAAEIAEMAR